MVLHDRESPPREVRVRAEYAELYPELPAGLWLLASQIAEMMVLRARTARSRFTVGRWIRLTSSSAGVHPTRDGGMPGLAPPID